MTAPAALVARVRAAVAGHRAAEIPDTTAARAAVALVIAREPEPSVLLVRRRERAGDPWSGHMALPGGFVATSDASLAVTAARETLEETGFDLAAGGELVGALDDISPRNATLPPVVVRPFVFLVDRTAPAPASDEVEEVLWLSVAELFDVANRTPLTIQFPSGSRTFASIQIRGYTIWGLTERILDQLGRLAGL